MCSRTSQVHRALQKAGLDPQVRAGAMHDASAYPGCRHGAVVRGSPARALNELVCGERERMIELMGALAANSDMVQMQQREIQELRHALQEQVGHPTVHQLQLPLDSVEEAHLLACIPAGWDPDTG